MKNEINNHSISSTTIESENIFNADVKAFNKPAVIRAAGVIAIALLGASLAAFTNLSAMPQSGGSQSPSDIQGNESLKSNLSFSTKEPDACEGQTWGHWDTACAQKLSGKKNLRVIKFKTAQTNDQATQTTTISRAMISD